jgi:sugar phosphate isomerase/epimerase
LAISTISTGQALGLEGISLTSLNPDIRAKAIIRIKEHIELATQLRSPLVTIGLIRGIGSLESRQQQLELFLESLSACAAYAQEHGVRLMVEPINRSETFLLNSTAETLEFLAKLPNGNVGVLLDTFHSNLEDVSIVDAIDTLGVKLFHVHFADSNRGLPGMGTIDFSAVVKALAGQSFNGFISLEALTLPDKETVRKESYSRLTQYFAY